MSLKFEIRNTAGKAEKEGDVTLRFTGTGEPFDRVSERDVKKIGVDGAGNPRLKFVTGLDETRVQFLPWYNEEEKKEVLKQVKELKNMMSEFYLARTPEEAGISEQLPKIIPKIRFISFNLISLFSEILT